MIFKGLNKKKIFYLWLLSYVIILVIPLSITISSYFFSKNVISEEIEKAGVASLRQAKDVLDNAFISIENLCSDIEIDVQLTNILYNEDPNSSKKQYDLYRLMKLINTYGPSNVYKEELVFYIRSLGILLSSSGKTSTDLFFKDNYILDNNHTINMDEYVENISGTGLYIMMNGNNKDKSLIYSRTMPSSNKTNYKSLAIMELNKAKLEETLNQAKWIKGSTVLMLKEQTQTLISVGEEIPTEWINKIDFKKANLVNSFMFDNKEYYYFYTSSKLPLYGYLMLIPEEVLFEKLNLLRNRTYIFIISAFVIGIILSYFFSRKNYLPLQRIIRMLMESGFAEKSFNSTNEIYLIQTSLSNIIKEMEKSKKWINDEKINLRDGFLRRLLNGKYNDYDKFDKILSLYNIQFASNDFLIMLIAAEETEGIISESDDKIRSALTFVLNRLLGEAIQKDSGIEFILFEIDRYQCVIFSFDETLLNEDAKQIIEQYYKQIEEEAKKLNILLTTVISSRHMEVKNLVLCYKEAVKTMEYVLLLNYPSLLSYEDMISKQKHSYKTCYDFEKEQVLVNLIRHGDYEKSWKFIDGIIQEMRDSQYSLEKVKCTIFSVINTILNSVPHKLNQKESFVDEVSPTKRLLSCNNIEEIYVEMKSMLKDASNIIKPAESKDKRIENIIKYINDNYTNSTFNVTNIANEFKINLTYMSTIFHESTGQTVLEYIQKVRVKRAKELLVNNSFNIKDISNMIGFQSCNSFIRVFKQYEGVTPGQYRNIHS